MSMWKLLLSLIWTISTLIFNISIATELKNLALPISGEKIYSIVVTPNKSHGASNYRLKIYTSEDQKIPTININHPLHGQISDVEIYDIDNDGKEELVIQSIKVASTAKVHNDIFELNGRSLFDKIRAFFHF